MVRLSALAVTVALFLCGTPAQAADGPEEVTVMSNEQHEEMLRGRSTAPREAATYTGWVAVASAALGCGGEVQQLGPAGRRRTDPRR